MSPKKSQKKSGNERTRREAAANNTFAGGLARVHDLDEPAGRSEARREAVMARKIRNQPIDSDFEERPSSRKQQPKSKKQPEQNQQNSSGPTIGIIATNVPQNKRKKPGPVAPAMERALSGAFSGQKSQIGSPILGADGVKKRKNPQGPLPGRKRYVAFHHDWMSIFLICLGSSTATPDLLDHHSPLHRYLVHLVSRSPQLVEYMQKVDMDHKVVLSSP